MSFYSLPARSINIYILQSIVLHSITLDVILETKPSTRHGIVYVYLACLLASFPASSLRMERIDV